MYVTKAKKIKLLIDKIKTEVAVLIQHRIATYMATVNFQIDKYCRLQAESYNMCLDIINTNPNFKYNYLFEQVFRCSRIFNSCIITHDDIAIDSFPRVNEKRYDVLFSCTLEYF